MNYLDVAREGLDIAMKDIYVAGQGLNIPM